MFYSFDTILSLFNTAVTSVAVLAGVFFMVRYLNRGESSSESRDIKKYQAELEQKLIKLSLDYENLAAPTTLGSSLISEEDRAALLHDLTENIKNQATQDTLSRLQTTVEENSKKNGSLALISRQCELTIDRLRQELFSLSKRGNLNLSIGIITTLTGLLLLGIFVLQEQQIPTDVSMFLMNFAPRLSLVIFIEVFAYFFLRLYKTTLTEIKHFRNEVTSMEAKFLALIVATENQSAEHLSKVIECLSQTERNFILNKDQTTIDLERSRMDHQERTNLWEKLGEIVKKKDS